MTNEIAALPGGIVQNTPNKATVNTQPALERTQTAAQGTTNRADSVSLSSTASQLQSLESQLASQPVVDMQRVNSVRHDIATNNYNIDPMAIAEKMLQFESETP